MWAWLNKILLIQGGMGVGISDFLLANAVARISRGKVLATVSGIAADILFARRLQIGDPGGHLRRAMKQFPFQGIAHEVLAEYFIEGGKSVTTPYKTVSSLSLAPPRLAILLHVCANFAFVWLTKEGHANPVSINWLEKMQTRHLASIYGAMLAGVDAVTMGAGIGDQVPDVLDAYARGEAAEYRVTVTNCPTGRITMRFDPAEFFAQPLPKLQRPAFIPIISSDCLASIMIRQMKKKNMVDAIQGFVVEGPAAGGHNAPPRKDLGFNEFGEPVYGKEDQPDFEKLKALGVPFWLGGGYASPEGLAQALSLGATGIQVGSIFALCKESGMDPVLRQEIIRRWHEGTLEILQDPHASPTGFPFRVAQLPGTLSDDKVFRKRHPACSLRALHMPHQMPDGSIEGRCPAEGRENFERHGGDGKDTVGRRCICHGLLSTARFGDEGEPQIVTFGGNASFLKALTSKKKMTYTVAEVAAYLLSAV